MNISFRNVENEKVRKCFLEVVTKYKMLHPFQLELKQRPIKSSTMQAQPVILYPT